MSLTRDTRSTSLIDVLDRILDKGIVIDAWVRISLVGVDLLTLEARIVLASLETYLNYAEIVGLRRLVSVPPSGTETSNGAGVSRPNRRRLQRPQTQVKENR